MNIYIDKQEIINFFNLLNKSNIEYILLRNIGNELPSKLKVGKDIDLLVLKKDIKKINQFFEINGYEKINHPSESDIYLYGVDKFEFRYNKNNKILIDLNFQLSCRSLDEGQWVPFDEKHQKSAWVNKKFVNNSDLNYYTLSFEDEFIALVIRSIFDKKKFEQGYIKRITKLIKLIDKDNVLSKFELTFFKYSKKLLQQLENKEFDKIINSYLSFKEY